MSQVWMRRIWREHKGTPIFVRKSGFWFPVCRCSMMLSWTANPFIIEASFRELSRSCDEHGRSPLAWHKFFLSNRPWLEELRWSIGKHFVFGARKITWHQMSDSCILVLWKCLGHLDYCYLLFHSLGNSHPNWQTHIFQSCRDTTNPDAIVMTMDCNNL